MLNLPVFDGVHASLEAFNKLKKEVLDKEKTEEYKRRRIQLKVERTKDAQRCKAWSKKHGHDTYGDDDCNDDDIELMSIEYKKQPRSAGMKYKACGSTAHLSHKDSPFNKKMKGSALQLDGHTESVSIDVTTSVLSDIEENSSKDSVLSSDSDWCFEDDIFSSDLCTCGAGSQAHKKDCVMSSRNRYPGCILFPKDPTIDRVPPPFRQGL